MESLDALRMNQFRCSSDNSPRTLPMTGHIKLACLQGGYEWRALVEDADFTDPHIGIGDSLIKNTLQNGTTPLIQLTLTI